MRFFGIIFALPFIFGPVAMMSMLWADDGWGAPPLAMKLAGTAICAAVGCAGLLMAFKALTGEAPQIKQTALDSQRELSTRQSNELDYACDNCGASISADADISPSGDVKCTYCNSWFNVK